MRVNDGMTAQELLNLELPGQQAELVRGKLLVREPPGARHGALAMRIGRLMAQHADLHGLGTVFAAETGFRLFSEPDTVRAPDAAFVRAGRLSHPLPDGYLDLAPDIVVEVISRGDRAGRILAKVSDWIEAGTAVVWVIDPARESVRVYRADGNDRLLTRGAMLDGESVIPGFSVPIAALFDSGPGP